MIPIPERLREWARRPHVSPFMARAFVATVVGIAIAVPLAIIAIPYIEFFNDMAVQHKVKPQMVWAVRDGRAISGGLPAPAGAVAMDESPYPFPVPRVPPRPGETPEERAARVAAQDRAAEAASAALAARGPAIPAPYVRPEPTMALMKRGQKRYNEVCVVCHGPFGMGDGRVPPRGFPPPANLLDARTRTFSEERIFHVITTGQGAMPSHALQLTPEDRWAVAYYVKALQRAFPAFDPGSSAPTTSGPRGEGVVRGEAAGQQPGRAGSDDPESRLVIPPEVRP